MFHNKKLFFNEILRRLLFWKKFYEKNNFPISHLTVGKKKVEEFPKHLTFMSNNLRDGSWRIKDCYSLWTKAIQFTFFFRKLFIVLKKKNSHLSFLYCYHHFYMVLGTHISAQWVPGGHGILLGSMNLLVHAFMYFYYFLTAFKPELKQSIWWKKHITLFQMMMLKSSNFN